MRLFQCLAPTLPWLLLAGVGSARAQDAGAYRIARITITRDPVFASSDTTRMDLVSAAANRLHITTRRWIIQNELLFAEGDVYDDDIVDESERNLRKLTIIGEVFIRRDTVNDWTIDLVVHTRDRWSLEAGGSYKQEGGIATSRITLQDGNFLGNAQNIRVSFNRRSDRDAPDGIDLAFHERRLLGSWWEGLILYKWAEELKQRSLVLQRSFNTEAATWAASLVADQRSLRLYNYQDGRRTHDFPLTRHSQTTWFAISSGNITKRRLGAALVRLRSSSIKMTLRPFDNLDLVSFSLSTRHRTFYKDTYLNNFGRTEDVPLG